LLLILLALRKSGGFLSGLVLGLGIFVKPLAALFVLIPALGRRWALVAGGLIAGLSGSIACIAVFGSQTFWAYFKSDVPHRVPVEMFSQGINQSLLGSMLKVAKKFGIFVPDPLHFLPFAIVAGLLIIVSGYAVTKVRSFAAQLSIGVALGLLLYPATLQHYGTYLLVPLFLLLREEDPRDRRWLPLLFGGLYFIFGFRGGAFSVFGFSALWGALILRALVYELPTELRTSAPANTDLSQVGEKAIYGKLPLPDGNLARPRQ